MFALDGATGRFLWDFASGSPVISGAAIAGGQVYWGSGYAFTTACPGGESPLRVCKSSGGALYAFTPSGE
jgi:outer membrane protein assembly factor BamB